MKRKFNQYGAFHALPLLLIVAVFGIIAYILTASTVPFKGGIFSILNSKPASYASGNGCVFSNGAQAAFCDTFDQPMNNGNRSGDLNGDVWGVSRATSNDNPTQGLLYNWAGIALNKCGSMVTVLPAQDLAICNGMFVEGVNDNGGQTDLAAYPKQPFDIAGRTGMVVFDVSADSQGPHAAWPAFIYTDQPIPAPYSSASALFDTARNSFGFTIANICTGKGGVGNGNCWYNNQPSTNFTGDCTTLDTMFTTTNYQEANLNFTPLGCVLEPSSAQAQAGQLNHFEVRISQTSVQVWASDPGSPILREIAEAKNVSIPLTRGLIWIEDVHYNANKFNTQQSHTFFWDNVGFDGPILPRDLAFDAANNNLAGAAAANGNPTVNIAYETPAIVQIPSVSGILKASGAILTLNFWPHNPISLIYSVNGHPAHTFGWPGYSTGTWGSQTVALPVPLSEIVSGINSVNIDSNDNFGLDVANIDLILIGAGGIPCSINPSQPCGSGSPNPTPTPSPTAVITPIPTPSVTPQPSATLLPIPSPSTTPTPISSITPSSLSLCGGADLNHDGVVNIFDYSILVGNYGKSEPAGTNGDINGSGVVDIFDYNLLISNFGKTGC